MRHRLVLLLAAVGLAAAACGGADAASSAQTGAADPSTTATTTTTTGSSDASATSTVKVASSSLGDILVDADGMTLYLFLPDDQSTPTCTDGCASAWPPLEGPATAADGADGSLLGTAEHPSGATQVTYNGWPLYHYAKDQAPGDVTGQDVGDKWYVVSPDGTAVTEADESASESESSSAAGYGTSG